MSDIKIKFTLAEWGKAPKDLSPEYKAMLALRGKGVAWKLVTAETGVGYASGWLCEARANLAAEQVIKVDPTKPEDVVKAIVHARLVENNSWGLLMARTGLPEVQVRRAFEQGTNVFSEGLRNGKGGRFLQDNAEAYAPAPKVGWVRTADGASLPNEIKQGLIKAGALPADVAELDAMTAKALKAMAADFGLDPSGKKADLVERIGKALNA